MQEYRVWVQEDACVVSSLRLRHTRTQIKQTQVTWRECGLKPYDHRHRQEEQRHLLTVEEEDLRDHQDYQLVNCLFRKKEEDCQIHSVQEAMAQEETETPVHSDRSPSQKPRRPQGRSSK